MIAPNEGPIASSYNGYEQSAKIAYGIWQIEAGFTTPYEFLPESEKQAWRKAVRSIRDTFRDPHPDLRGEQGELVVVKRSYRCDNCRRVLVCPKCDTAAAPLPLLDESGVWAI